MAGKHKKETPWFGWRIELYTVRKNWKPFTWPKYRAKIQAWWERQTKNH